MSTNNNKTIFLIVLPTLFTYIIFIKIFATNLKPNYPAITYRALSDSTILVYDNTPTLSHPRNVKPTTHLKKISMSKKGIDNATLQDVTVEVPKRRESNGDEFGKKVGKSKNRSDFVYVNNAYVGSLNSVNEVQPPTSVIREQYWACSKWPTAQRVLAVLVGVLLGAVIGLALTLAIRATAPEIDLSFLKASAPD